MGRQRRNKNFPINPCFYLLYFSFHHFVEKMREKKKEMGKKGSLIISFVVSLSQRRSPFDSERKRKKKEKMRE